jgi:acyl-CoA hydrolase
MVKLEARPVQNSLVNMTELVLPSYTNAIGSIFGGTIMSWIDIAAAISAQRHSSCVVVTASVDDLHFLNPAYLGWVISLRATVNYVANTSMEVGVRVDAQNPRTLETFKTAKAYLTFVALDDDGHKCKVRPLLLESEDEERRNKEAAIRRTLRLERKKAFSSDD